MASARTRGATLLSLSNGFVRSDALHLDLLAAHLVLDSLYVIASFPLNDDFFGDVNRLSHYSFLGGFGDFDSLVGPVEVTHVVGIGNRATKNASVLFVQGHLRFHGRFGY